jgi:hypothetical protein
VLTPPFLYTCNGVQQLFRPRTNVLCDSIPDNRFYKATRDDRQFAWNRDTSWPLNRACLHWSWYLTITELIPYYHRADVKLRQLPRPLNWACWTPAQFSSLGWHAPTLCCLIGQNWSLVLLLGCDITSILSNTTCDTNCDTTSIYYALTRKELYTCQEVYIHWLSWKDIQTLGRIDRQFKAWGQAFYKEGVMLRTWHTSCRSIPYTWPRLLRNLLYLRAFSSYFSPSLFSLIFSY